MRWQKHIDTTVIVTGGLEIHRSRPTNTSSLSRKEEPGFNHMRMDSREVSQGQGPNRVHWGL